MKALLFLLLLLLPTAAAADSTYWVAKTGTDVGNNCLNQSNPCLTIQHAVDQVANGSIGSIRVGDGVYVETIYVNYYRFVGIAGNCSVPGAVTLKAVSAYATIVLIQDNHAAFAAPLFDRIVTT
jgi:hypothetical protein